MINLIPNQEKKQMLRGFYFRVCAFCLLALSIVVLIATVATLPAYFLSSVRQNLVAERLLAQKSTPVAEVDPQIALAASDLEKKLKLVDTFSKNENRFLVSEQVINNIALRKTSDIKITQFLYENDLKLGKKIGISGTAPSRERLLLFRLALEDSGAFKKVDLPVSNFLKGTNIQFYISVFPQ